MTNEEKLTLLDELIEFLNSVDSPTKKYCDENDLLQTIYDLCDNYRDLERRLGRISELL